jgi:hypothetical protein
MKYVPLGNKAIGNTKSLKYQSWHINQNLDAEHSMISKLNCILSEKTEHVMTSRNTKQPSSFNFQQLSNMYSYKKNLILRYEKERTEILQPNKDSFSILRSILERK